MIIPAQLALAACLGILLLASLIARNGGSPSLPKTDGLWFHATVTWPIVVKTALGSFIFSQDADGGTSYVLVTYGPAAVMSLVLLARRVRGDAKIFAPGVWTFIAVALSLPFALTGSAGIGGILPVLFILPMLFRGSDPFPLSAWFKSVRRSLLLIVSAITGTAFVAPLNVIGVCRLDKCSMFGEVLTSPITNNGNFAGLAVAILLPFALLGLPKFPMLMTAAAGLAMVELSGSRSAAIAAWIVTAVVMLSSKNWSRRSWIAGTVLFATLAASIVTAVGDFPPSFATWRGGLWIRARELFFESPVFGFGPYYWSEQPQEVSFIANYSPHNFWLEAAVSGGVIGLVCMAAAGITLLRSVDKQERYAFVMAFVALLAIGILEAPIQPGKLGLAPFAHLLPLMIAATCTVGSSSVTQPGGLGGGRVSDKSELRQGSADSRGLRGLSGARVR